MASSFSGFVLDPSKCSQLSMEEKRELVYEISKWSEGAPEMLQSWSRRELLEILCAEMGKERKYTGLTKYKIIEILLKIVSEKSAKASNGADSRPDSPTVNSQSSSKRRRKMDNPSRVTTATTSHPPGSDGDGIPDNVIFCGNAACRASVRPQDAFCKRCSCCICHKYDDNKDPSVWLICDSEPPNEGDSCGISCHVECALKDERTGFSNGKQSSRLDGSFYCVSCGKVNDLLGCWRKQIVIAKDARRVDILCYRISLSHRLLRGTVKYQELHAIVDTIAKKLEVEVGSLDGLRVNMARGIVNRLSCGSEIQKLCASAVRILDAFASKDTQPSTDCNILDSTSVPPTLIRFEDTSPTSLNLVLSSSSSTENVIGYTMWHKKADTADYPKEPTATAFQPITRFSISDLSPATEYVFKIHSLSNSGEISRCEARFMTGSSIVDVANTLATEAGSSEPECESPRANCSGLSNPSSEVDESNSKPSGDLHDSPGSYSGNFEKPKNSDPNIGKLIGYAHKESGECQDDVPVLHKQESNMQEETPVESISALDEEHVTAHAVSEPNLTIRAGSQRDSTNSSEDNLASVMPKLDDNHNSKGRLIEDISAGNESNAPMMEVVPFRSFDSPLPATPHKLEMVGQTKPINSEPKNQPIRSVDPQAGSSSRKRIFVRCEEMCDEDGSMERDYAYSVKIVRLLECEGHVEENFRVKFLTWFSLWATPQERKIVRVYIDTLIDDPPSLAGQLIDTFSERIYRKRPPVPTGFCMKLWH